MSWVWDHFTKKDGKAVCKVAKANGEPCNQQLEWKKSTTSLSYHLTNVHGLEKGSAGPQHKRMKFSLPAGPVMTEKETFCATWALNALSFDLIDACSDLRNRLKECTVDALMFVRMNLRPLGYLTF